jgi:ubiquinone/menaquinone biosynthesis C-methylase UbiE
VKPNVQRLYDRHYPVVEGDRRRGDGSRTFYDWIRSTPGIANAKVLNVGAGPTPEPAVRRLRGEVGRLVGVDVDPVVLTNQDLDEAHVGDGTSLPFPEAEFDFVYSDWTVEHVEKPVAFLREIRRVLKPGGELFFRTTNRGHYVTLVSAHTPHWFHKLVANRARDLKEDHHEPWPTYYRMNSRAVVRRQLQAAGFDGIAIELIEPYPVYLVFNPLAFRLGIAYERLVNRWAWSSRFRLILIARARATKPLRAAAENAEATP